MKRPNHLIVVLLSFLFMITAANGFSQKTGDVTEVSDQLLAMLRSEAAGAQPGS